MKLSQDFDTYESEQQHEKKYFEIKGLGKKDLVFRLFFQKYFSTRTMFAPKVEHG